MGKRAILDAGILSRGMKSGSWASSQGWFLGTRRKLVGGDREPGSFDFLGTCLATVAPGDVGIPQQEDRINGDSQLFTKGQPGSSSLNMLGYYCNSDILYRALPGHGYTCLLS